MAVQLLRLRAFTAIGLGSIPGQRSKIPQTVWCGQKKEKSQHLGVKAARQRESYLPFVLFKPSPGCTRPICIREGVCFTQTVNSHVNLMRKHPD